MFGSHLPGVFRPRPHGTRLLLHPDSDRSEVGEPRTLHLRVGSCGASALTSPAVPYPRPPGPPALSPTRLVICRPRPGYRAPRSQPARTSSATSRAHLPGARPRAPIPLRSQPLAPADEPSRLPHPHAGVPASYCLPGSPRDPPTARLSLRKYETPPIHTPPPARGPAHQPRKSQYPVSASRGPAYPPNWSQSRFPCAPRCVTCSR